MAIEQASRLYSEVLAEEAAAQTSGDAMRWGEALIVLTKARKALDDTRPRTSLDFTACLLATS